MVILDDIYTFKDFGLIPLLGHEHPIVPDITNKTLKIPGKAGEYYFGTEIGTKPFSIPLGIMERDRIELQQKLNSLVAFLFDQYGNPRTIKMSFNYEPDKYYMVRVNGSVSVERMMIAAEFEIPFIAYDPYKYSVAYTDEITWGSTVITFQSHYTFGHDGTIGTVHLTTDSEDLKYFVDGLAVKPIIEITGSATGLVLFTGEYTIEFQDFTDVDWIIDCEKYTVLKNGQNAFNEVNLREFILIPGMNRIGSYGDTIDLDIRMKVRDKYI